MRSLTFSPDGILLVSGSEDKTIKLWDIQTGGVVRTFQGHTDRVRSVSISANCTIIASGSNDKTIRLWDTQTGVCYCIIQQEDIVASVHFFPLDPQYLTSVSGGKVSQWDIDGHQITPTHNGSCTAFSSDGTKFAFCNEGVVQIQSPHSRAVVAEFHMENVEISYCCFSPNGRLFAIVVDHTAYVWDITCSDPCLVETFIGHTGSINSLVFSSPTSLISVSMDKSIKLWQVGTPPTATDVTGSNSIILTSPIKSITLQAKDGIAISADSDGVVRIWDLSTGHCKASFQTPAQGDYQRDAQLINNQLILVWYTDKKIYILDAEKGELLQTVDVSGDNVKDLRISGDGSKVFCMDEQYICAWNIWTGEVMDRVEFGLYPSEDPFLTIDGTRVWVSFPPSLTMGWDFETSGSSPIELICTPFPRPHLDFIGGIREERSILPGIEDTITGKEVFQLPSKHARPADVQWDGQYLVAGYSSGEVLILDCTNLLPH